MPADPVVRLTGGALRGRRVRGAHGVTRPATARLRRSIFDRPDVQEAVAGPVLDLFAGAGLLGLEALSRDAPRVDFVERDRGACGVIRDNLASLGCEDRATLYCRAVEAVLPRLRPGYRLCFVDPPYPVDAAGVVRDLLQRELLREGGVLLWRHPRARLAPPVLPHDADQGPRLVRVDQRRYGDAVLDTYLAAAGGETQPNGGRGAAR